MSERNVFARHAKLYSGTPENSEWVANVTEVSATGRNGKYEGTMTVDQINANFEKKFIDFLNAKDEDYVVPEYILECSLEDPGPPSTSPDPEKLVFRDVKFWSIPIGFSRTDIVTRDIDFTAREEKGHRRDYTFRFVNPDSDGDNSVPAS